MHRAAFVLDGEQRRYGAHDIHKMAKHGFTARLAGVLGKACGEGQFDRLVLVALPRSLGERRSLLSERVKKAVSHEAGKDLTGSTPTELRAHARGPEELD